LTLSGAENSSRFLTGRFVSSFSNQTAVTHLLYAEFSLILFFALAATISLSLLVSFPLQELEKQYFSTSPHGLFQLGFLSLFLLTR